MLCVEYKKFTQRSSSVEFFKKSVALKVCVVCFSVPVYVYLGMDGGVWFGWSLLPQRGEVSKLKGLCSMRGENFS